MDGNGVTDDLATDGHSSDLHALDRRLDLAFAAVAAVPPGAFVSGRSPSGTLERPALLADRLPAVHWLEADQHPLTYIDPQHHLRIHQAWVDACQGPDRIGRTRLLTSQPLPGADRDGQPGAVGWYDVTFVDLTGIAGIDVVVVTLVPADADVDPDAASSAPDPSTSASWFRGTTSFRLRLSARGAIEGGTLNVDEVLGRSLPELIGTNMRDLAHPDDIPAAIEAWRRITTSEDQVPPTRARLSMADGSWRWFEATSWNVLDVPQLGAVISEFRDVQDQVDAEEARVATSRAHVRLVKVVDEVDDLIMVGRLDGDLVYVNEAAARLIGADSVGQPLGSRMRRDVRQFAKAVIEPAIRRLERWTGDLEVKLDGRARTMATTVTPVIDEGTEDIYFGVIMHDVTETRSHARALADQARSDPLTGLPNRLALMEHLERCRTSGNPETMVSVCFVDLDNLKVVNDGLGHSAGDRLLQAVGSQLLAQPGSLVARFGGDEFVVVREGLDATEALEAAKSLLADLEQVKVLGVASHVTASVGVASCPRGLLDPEGIIRDADAAMYGAKRTGRARIVSFDEDMRQVVTRRFFLETSLRQALLDQDLELHLQPVVDLASSDAVEGYEALTRWQVAEPTEFIPIAEDSGLIVPLGRWALRGALDALRQLQRVSPQLTSLRMSVNVSGHQLLEHGFVDLILDALVEHDVPPQSLVLELTESVLIDPRNEVDDVLRALRDAGMSLALDDFGSGYSSLGYLRRYPIDILKLDTSYTQALLDDLDTRIIAEAVITMAKRLGLRVVAEGVETPDQLELVRELGIDWAQGYLLGKPEPVQRVVDDLTASFHPR